jgi:hypothetical protein
MKNILLTLSASGYHYDDYSPHLPAIFEWSRDDEDGTKNVLFSYALGEVSRSTDSDDSAAVLESLGVAKVRHAGFKKAFDEAGSKVAPVSLLPAWALGVSTGQAAGTE